MANGNQGHFPGQTASDFYNLFAQGQRENVSRAQQLPSQANYNQALQGGQALVNLAGLLGGSNALGFMGFGNLAEILARQGRTDPKLFNQQIADIQRGTQGQQQAIQQQGAQAGLQGSGVMAALQAAAGQSGEDRIATARAEETARSEQRMRDDLDLLLRMFIQPSTDVGAIATGQYSANRSEELRRQAATEQAAGELFTGIMSALIMSCWVAREVYGVTDPRWLLARHYVVNMSPWWFFGAYMRYGERFAAWVRTTPIVKRIIRPAFDWMCRRALKEIGNG